MLAAVAGLAAAPGRAHTVFVAVDNHTDYNWNAPAAFYDAAMLQELDFYLAKVDETVGNDPAEQSRYMADNWWYLYLYEQNRSAAEFADLIAKMRSGHITIPLNPFVTLYGAMSTEMAIRAGYYPGRIARAHDVEFLLSYASVENTTIPWGLASIFSGSGARYAWKGICGCVSEAPFQLVPEELFHWEGPDAQTLLTKWYRLLGFPDDRGGYAEARANLNTNALADEIAQTETDQPGVGATGLFGAGEDLVSYQNLNVVNAVSAFNDSGSPDQAVVSNGVDFFETLESSGVAATLPTLRGGWGNDWDMWPSSLAARTARQRRAIERLRTAEALAIFGQWRNADFWAPLQLSLEGALTSTWKYFEHGWNVTGGPLGPTLAQMAADKETWTQDIEQAVDNALQASSGAFATLFETPDEDRAAVFNPLAFERTDFADLAVNDAGPYVVTDVETGQVVASQVVSRGAQLWLRWLASDVPSFGYRSYAIGTGTPPALPAAAAVDVAARTIESGLYRVALGGRGQIVSALEKTSEPDVELAGTGGLNDWGSGNTPVVVAENVGPVSATLRMDLQNPSRTVRVTLYRDVDRIDVENEVTQNVSGFHAYAFDVHLDNPQLHFEEVGAIARPGFVGNGGDYLPGTRASRLTLNHFVGFAVPGYSVILSNWDAYAMRVGQSTNTSFDLDFQPGEADVSVVVTERQDGAGVGDQGGDPLFQNRFALRGLASGFSAAESLRTSLGHQNPLRAIPLPRNQAGPLSAPLRSFLGVSSSEVVVTAVKPAEEAERGFVVRVWELGGSDRSLDLDVAAFAPTQAFETSLIETDRGLVSLAGGRIQATIGANQMKTWRFVPAPEPSADGLRLAALGVLGALAARHRRRARYRVAG